MAVEYASQSDDTARPKRPVWRSIGRGFRLKCPCCGRGSAMEGYAAVATSCDDCGEVLHHHRADDFPAYIVIMIVGHIIVPLALLVEQSYRPDLWIHMALWLPFTLILALGLLPCVKGAVVGWQWACRMHGFGVGQGND